MTRSGATWCEKHTRWECSAKVGREHHATAMRGMAHCKHHVGKTTALARAQGEANLLAWATTAHVGAAPLDPGQVVMDQLRVAVLRADLYGEMLRLQLGDEGIGGLVGLTYAAGREGARVETGEGPRGLGRLEAEWRDRVVRFAKAAHDMGIAERHVELEQERAQLVTTAFLAALEVGALLPEVRSLMIERFLERLGGSTVAGEVVAP